MANLIAPMRKNQTKEPIHVKLSIAKDLVSQALLVVANQDR